MNFFKAFSLLLMLPFFTSCDLQQNDQKSTKSGTMSYDSTLANEVGADVYGMKVYVMAFLKEGPNRDQDSVTAANIQRAHLDNIKRMAQEGTLVFAGPFMDEFDIKGIYIFDVPTIEEARDLTNTDPAVQSGRLEMELHQLYGSAALKMVNEWSKKITKESI